MRIGAGLLLIGLFGMGAIGAWGLVGLVPLGTGLLRMCPVYRLFGVHTGGAKAQRLP